jgi:hypothetical protein
MEINNILEDIVKYLEEKFPFVEIKVSRVNDRMRKIKIKETSSAMIRDVIKPYIQTKLEGIEYNLTPEYNKGQESWVLYITHPKEIIK